MQWRYDENRADFRPALPGEIEADPDALYIVNAPRLRDRLERLLGGVC